MKGKVTVFGSGKMIGVGTKSVKDAEKDLTIAYTMLMNVVEKRSTASNTS